MSFYSDKSPFWLYFRERLGFSLIAVPGVLAAIIHGLARYLDTVRADIYWLRDQFVATKTDENHIPLFGDSRAVPRTRYDSSRQYRTRVEKAYQWHTRGGKVQGLPEILADYGFTSGRVRNLRQANPELWAHFDVTLVKPPKDFGQEDIDAVLALANQYKPARSKIGIVQFASVHQAPLALGAYCQSVIKLVHRVVWPQAKPPAPVSLRLGATAHVFVTIAHHVRRDFAPRKPVAIGMGAAAHSFVFIQHKVKP